MNKEQLSIWLHNTYEDIAKQEKWNTQKSCKVRFEDLPESNKRTMIELADRLLNF